MLHLKSCPFLSSTTLTGKSLKLASLFERKYLILTPKSQSRLNSGNLLHIPSRYAFSRSISYYPRTFSSTPSPKMSTQIIEHIVLFKTKEGTSPEKIDAMISGLRGLSSLEPVLHITAGPITRNRSSSFQFTHFLHSRYIDKEGLSEYSRHPAHLYVVKEFVLPICDDIIAMDWVADLDGPVVPTSGALRLTLLKPKGDLGGGVRGEVVRVLGGIKGSFPLIEQVSFGENFSPARAKGFTMGFLSFFRGLNEIDALDTNEEQIKIQKEKVRPLLESVIVVDYAIPLSANL